MSGFLLDTNVISELVKAKPEPRVTAWIEDIDESLLYLSVLTLGEMRKGITSLRDGARRVSLEAWLDRHLVLRFSDRILSIDLDVADRWGRIAGTAAERKKPLPVVDGLLAAIRDCDPAAVMNLMEEAWRLGTRLPQRLRRM